MEPEARFTLVGAVVVILIAVLAGVLVWLRSTAAAAGAQQYRIYFERQSLDGVEPRGDVRMRGIRVGSILSVRLSPQRSGVGEVLIAVAPDTPVRADTQAVVDRNLMTGLATLDLVGGTGAGPPPAAPPGERYPVIAEGESPNERLWHSLSDLARQADDTLRSANGVLSPRNRAALEQTLANLQAASQKTQGTLERADAALGSIRGAADSATALIERYRTLGAEAEATVREARDAVRKAGDDVGRAAARADEVMATGGGDLRDTARSVRAAADSIATAADRLRDPGQAILGPPRAALGPGEASP